MAKRRGNNEGCIYQRKDGLWCAQVSLEGRRLTKYGKTRMQCREWIRQTLTKIEGGLTFEGTQLTLEQYMPAWLDGKAISQRPQTMVQYRQICTSISCRSWEGCDCRRSSLRNYTVLRG